MPGAPRSPGKRTWLVAGPALLLAGFCLGKVLPVGQERPSPWREPRDPGPVSAATPPWSFADVVEKVRDGVVGIRTIRMPRSGETHEDSLGVVTGSGFVIHEEGLVMTNQHLVADALSIKVQVPGYRAMSAEVVGEDPRTDVAVLRLERAPAGLQVLALGDSQALRQGDWVVTVGNPFEFEHTVTAGVVSYVGRHLKGEGGRVMNEFLQFSAPVNPGSSGGPVVDLRGNVVGLTTRVHPFGQGLSFAVPSRVLKWVLRAFEEHGGHVRRAHLGIGFDPLEPATARELGVAGGAVIREVLPGCPGATAGLRPGDIVVEVDGRPLGGANELYDRITYGRPGAAISLGVVRSGERLAPIAVALGELPATSSTAPSADPVEKVDPDQ